MVFASTVFLFLFLPLVVLIYHGPWARSQSFRNGFLLLSSLGFYAWGEPIFIFLMLFSILITWMAGHSLERYGRKKSILVIGVTYHLLMLFIFKYMGAVLEQVGLMFFHSGIELDIELPIGISFFTFQMMSYLFDVYYKRADVQESLFRLALYVSFFPQLIAGPIVRYNQIEQEIGERTTLKTDLTEGMERFIYGLAKKVLLSDYLAFIADSIFGADERSIAAAWLGGICYALQIYFDFSGYSDMAIGLGRLFGFHFSENFEYPYISKSITEFWRRWHISLGTWFRDYVYIPLGGNRVPKKRWLLNLFLVWGLTGIWHGANWTFLVWGLLYFAILLVEKLTGFTERIGRVSHLYTLVIVILAWVIFRSDSVSEAVLYIGDMFGARGAGFIDDLAAEMAREGTLVTVIGAVLSLPIYKKLLEKTERISKNLETTFRSVICMALFLISVTEIVASSYSPFIYFNF